VALLDDGHHLLDDTGHGVREAEVAGGEARVDEVQRERHRLAVRQGRVEASVEGGQQRLRGGVLAGIQVLDLAEQRILDGEADLLAPHGEGDVVGEGDDQGGAGRGAGVQAGVAQGGRHHVNVLRGDPRQQLREVVRVAPVRGAEDPNHLGVVDGLTRPGLETQAPAGQDDLAPRVVPREDDVVVEDPQDFHGHHTTGDEVTDSSLLSGRCR